MGADTEKREADNMYRRDTKSWLKHLDFMILDLIVLQISFVLAYTPFTSV